MLPVQYPITTIFMSATGSQANNGDGADPKQSYCSVCTSTYTIMTCLTDYTIKTDRFQKSVLVPTSPLIVLTVHSRVYQCKSRVHTLPHDAPHHLNTQKTFDTAHTAMPREEDYPAKHHSVLSPSRSATRHKQQNDKKNKWASYYFRSTRTSSCPGCNPTARSVEP